MSHDIDIFGIDIVVENSFFKELYYSQDFKNQCELFSLPRLRLLYSLKQFIVTLNYKQEINSDNEPVILTYICNSYRGYQKTYIVSLLRDYCKWQVDNLFLQNNKEDEEARKGTVLHFNRLWAYFTKWIEREEQSLKSSGEKISLSFEELKNRRLNLVEVEKVIEFLKSKHFLNFSNLCDSENFEKLKIYLTQIAIKGYVTDFLGYITLSKSISKQDLLFTFYLIREIINRESNSDDRLLGVPSKSPHNYELIRILLFIETFKSDRLKIEHACKIKIEVLDDAVLSSRLKNSIITKKFRVLPKYYHRLNPYYKILKSKGY